MLYRVLQHTMTPGIVTKRSQMARERYGNLGGPHQCQIVFRPGQPRVRQIVTFDLPSGSYFAEAVATFRTP